MQCALEIHNRVMFSIQTYSIVSSSIHQCPNISNSMEKENHLVFVFPKVTVDWELVCTPCSRQMGSKLPWTESKSWASYVAYKMSSRYWRCLLFSSLATWLLAALRICASGRLTVGTSSTSSPYQTVCVFRSSRCLCFPTFPPCFVSHSFVSFLSFTLEVHSRGSPFLSPPYPPLIFLPCAFSFLLAFLFLFTSLPLLFLSSSLPSSLFTVSPSLTLLLSSPSPSLLLPPFTTFSSLILPLTAHLCSSSTDVSITSLSYSPDASHLATGLTTGEVKVFEISSSNVIFTLSKPEVRNWWIGNSMTPCVLHVLVVCLQLKCSNSSATFLMLL